MRMLRLVITFFDNVYIKLVTFPIDLCNLKLDQALLKREFHVII